MDTKISFRVELANYPAKGDGGLGNYWGVARLINGCRNTWVLPPQASEEKAREVCAALNAEVDK